MASHNIQSRISVENREKIMILKIDRPEKKNAITKDMYRFLSENLKAADEEASVHAVLLTGVKDCFSSGNDLNDFMAERKPGEKSEAVLFLETVIAMKKPLIAAVSGPAVGIGMTMLLHCDLVYAAENALFHLPFVSLGLCAEGGSSYLLPRLIGHQRASEMLLLGEPIPANTAWEYGFINNVFREEDLFEETLRIARKLAAQPIESVCLTKRLMKESRLRPVREIIETESRHFAERLSSMEFKEAANAFFRKKKPPASDGN